MKKTGITASLLAVSAFAAIAVSASSAHAVACLPGYVYIAAVNTCVKTPYIINANPGAFGCTHGGVVTGNGNVVCLPVSHRMLER